MHFLIQEILSFNLMYVAACYLVGTGMCHNMVGLLQHYKVLYKTNNDHFGLFAEFCPFCQINTHFKISPRICLKSEITCI